MSKRRRCWLLLLAVVSLTFTGLYESVTHVGCGWLRGEAFFEGRPTSWWRRELECWEVHGWGDPRVGIYSRKSIGFVELWERITGMSDHRFFEELKGPSLLRGGNEATPVLRELLHDPSFRVRRFAQIALQIEPEIPRNG